MLFAVCAAILPALGADSRWRCWSLWTTVVYSPPTLLLSSVPWELLSNSLSVWSALTARDRVWSSEKKGTEVTSLDPLQPKDTYVVS